MLQHPGKLFMKIPVEQPQLPAKKMSPIRRQRDQRIRRQHSIQKLDLVCSALGPSRVPSTASSHNAAAPRETFHENPGRATPTASKKNVPNTSPTRSAHTSATLNPKTRPRVLGPWPITRSFNRVFS